MHMRDIDFNLFVYLRVLLEEESVSRAAQRLNLSQSAMSHALRRIRDLLDDPVLVSSNGRMRRTSRMDEAYETLQQLAELAGDVLRKPHQTDIREIEGSLSFFASEDVFQTYGPHLMQRLREVGFTGQVEMRGVRRVNVEEKLEGLRHGFAILPSVYTPPRLKQRKLAADRFVCLARPGHPIFETPQALGDYLDVGHAMVRPMDWEAPSPLDMSLQVRGETRRIELVTAYFSVALDMVRTSDLVLTLPDTLARIAEARGGLALFDCPLNAPPLNLSLVWHERFTKDGSSRALRNLIVDAIAEVTGQSGDEADEGYEGDETD
jgi:DNA-binding transcriptional LysR family regulator